VQDRHGALLGRARKAVAEEPPDERDKLVVDEDLLQELHEPRSLCHRIELDGRQLGYQVLRQVRPQRAGP
jgi:hypothetical protein